MGSQGSQCGDGWRRRRAIFTKALLAIGATVRARLVDTSPVTHLFDKARESHAKSLMLCAFLAYISCIMTMLIE